MALDSNASDVFERIHQLLLYKVCKLIKWWSFQNLKKNEQILKVKRVFLIIQAKYNKI